MYNKSFKIKLMPSIFSLSKNEKLKKILLEAKENLNDKTKKIKKAISDSKKKIELMLPAKNEEEKTEDVQDDRKQSLVEVDNSNEESPEVLEKKRKREVIFELALFLILGILLGITIKTEAVKRITIGFSDYKIIEGKQGYNFQELEKNLELKQEAASMQNQEQLPEQPQQ